MLDNDLLLYGQHILVPSPLQKEMMKKLHVGYISRHRELQDASQSISLVAKSDGQHPRHGGAMYCVCSGGLSPVSDYPWQILGSDLFKIKVNHYLLAVDSIPFLISPHHPAVVHLLPCQSSQPTEVNLQARSQALDWGDSRGPKLLMGGGGGGGGSSLPYKL